MSGLDAKTSSWPGVGFSLLVNLIVVSCFFSPGTGDVAIWETWMREISSYGVIGGFAHTGTDYPPLAFIILGAVVRSAQAFGVTELLVLKCSLLLFLFATTACFYWFTRKLVLSVALELSLVLNSVALGYLDIYFAPFLIAGLFLLRRQHLIVGFLFYAISCSIKWQPLIIAPFVCLYVLSVANTRSTGRDRIKSQLAPFAISALLFVIPILAVFAVPAVFDSLRRAMTYHKFLSGYALNLAWIQTWALDLLNPEKYGGFLPGGVIDAVIARDPLIVWPNKVLFYLTYATVFFVFARQTKTFQRLIIYSTLGYLAYFSFNTGVHENHLFLVCCLGWVLVFLEPEQLVCCINFSMAANANLFLFYGAFGQRLNPVIAGVDITLVFALVNLCLFAGFLLHTFKADNVGLKFWQLRKQLPSNTAS